MIIICPYDRIAAAVERHGAGAAISILDSPMEKGIAGIPPERHLKVAYSMADAHTAPVPCCDPGAEEQRIRSIIDFAKGHDWDTPLLIHCRLGLCRSPAAALIVQCALSPERDEIGFAEELRTLSRSVDPSLSMIAQADCMLERDGRMLDALDAMGAGCCASVGDILRIPYLPEQ